MSYKDLLVVLDAEATARERIDFASSLAERFSAHLIGLYPLPMPETPRHLGYYDPALLDPFFTELRERARNTAVKVREAFDHAAGLRGLSAEWREIPEGPDADAADIALHLARHGVKAQTERTVSAGLPVGEVLLSRAADLGADLIVMGAYGHSRVREMLLGGTTRSVLRSMTVPVLMSH